MTEGLGTGADSRSRRTSRLGAHDADGMAPLADKLVSVIVLNYNGKDLLPECLAALRRQTHRNRELIFVDNGSTDGSADALRSLLAGGEGRLVVLGDNLGFAGGNAEGFKAAAGEYVALLNNDALPGETWLAELVAAMDSDPAAGTCASLLVARDDPGRIDSAGDGCVTSGHGIKRGSGEPAAGYSAGGYVFGACAAAVLYRRAMLDDVGFLDADFFLNCEDTDLNFRAQLMGWKCRYVPEAVVRHGVSTSIGRLSDLGVYHSSRNDEYVWVKNMPAWLMVRYFHHKVVQWFGSFVYFCVKRGKWRAWLGGKLAAAGKLPVLLRKRREIQTRRRVDDRYVASILTSILDRRMLRGKLRRLLSFK